MGPKVKKEGERDKLTNCAQCSAVFSSKDAEKHSIECCEAIRTRRFGDCLSQFSHGFIAGEVFLLQIIEEATNVPSKSTDFPSIRLSVATMKQSGIGVGDAVWLQFANGTKSVAVVEPAADPMAIFTCSLRPKVISNGCVMMRKSDCPTAVAKEIKIELSEEKSFKDDLVFHRFIILKLLDRPVYLGQIVVVNYFAQRVKVELKAVVTEENDTEAISDRLTAVSLVDSNDSAVNVTPIKFRPDVNFSSTPAVVKIRSTEPSEQLYWITDKTTISTGNQETTEDRMTFDQIGGCFNAKKDLKLFLIDPLRISGVAQCSSFLLHGVSGTGKTLLGKSLRYETDLTAHFVTPSDEDVKAKVTGWLKNSRQSTLIVADNFDGFLEAKGKDSNLQSFWCSTLDSLRGTRVIFVAITNRLENVDSRLRSRFDVEVEVMVPNEVERKDILSRLLNAFDHCLSDSDCEIVSGKAHGYTGADLNAVCRQAASVAFRKNSRICIQDLLDSLTRVRPSAMKEVTLEIPKVYWSDIGGMEDVKLKLNQSVEWPLKHRESFRRLGIKPPVGVLLYGPPGCSKTLIAKALATESGLNFLSIKGPEVFSKWVGDSEKAIRDIFRKARQAAPCVIFFDEIDSLAASRSSGNGQAVGDRVLTQMLTEIDGIEGLENVIILAATNRPDTIDSALLRPGRLDRLVYVPLPDARARREIFGIRLRQTPADPDVNLDELVGATEGFSGAEVVVVCNEAALEAMMESVGITTVAMRHFRKALSDAKPRTDQTLLSLYERFKAHPMEYRTIIYNAARDGNLRRLKVFLDCRVADEVKNLLTASTLGTPPLVIASRNGHLECCKYLVEKGADLELAGSVTFDGENIEGAPPLWCASAAGHYEVVVFLVSSGANVNNTTVTNSTPLRAACFDGHLKIVKYLVEQGADMEIANSHGHTSLMIACYRGHPEVVEYLLQKGADVNRRSVKGNTAMHDCAESGSLEIMRLLLDHGAKMERDAYGLTPLIAAACVGNSAVVDFLVQCPKCSLQERVDALELLGANYIDKKRDIIGAIQYWRRALLLRTMHSVQVHAARLTELGCTDFKFLSITETAGMADSFDPENIPAEELKPLKPKKRDPVPAYKNQVEFENAAELDALRSDPDAIRMQALCIRERILGPAHPDTSYYIRYRGAVYADIGNCQRCIELWLYALDMQQRTLEPLCSMTLSSFISFAELFSFMLNDSFTNRPAPNNNINANPPEHPHGENADVDGQPGAAAAAVNNNFLQAGQKPAALCFEQIITVVDRAVEEIRKGIRQQTDKAPVTGSNCKHSDKESAGSSNVQRMNLITLHLICQMCRLESRMSPEEHQRLKKTVYSLLALDPRDVNGGPSLLQLACNFDSSTIGRYPVCRFPSLSVVQLLLSVGADVNATDGQGNTALHTVLSNKVARPSIVRCLLEAGGHIDSKNRAGVTPLDLLKQGSCDTCPMNYMTLKCFAAQAIMKNNLGYRGNSIPTHLHNFVAMH